MSNALAIAPEATGRVYVEDGAGAFAIASERVFDAVTLVTAATLDPPAHAAALTHQDHELWWFSEGARAGQVHIANVMDFLGN